MSYASRIKEYRTVQSADLQRNPLNFRRHPETQRAALRSLLTSVGRVAPLLAYEHDGILTLLDGHARLDESDEWDVAILDIDESEAATVLAMLDKIGADAEIDPEALLALLDTLPTEARQTAGQAWSDDELAAIIGEAAIEPGAGGDEYLENIPELPRRVEYGDLWRLGDHLLLCGDSTKSEDVARLMQGERAALTASDPPYNVDIEYGDGTDDDKSDAAYEAFTRAWFGTWRAISTLQIVTPGYNNLASWMRFFDKPHHVAPWTKTNSMTRGHVSLFACWEPVLFYGEKWDRGRANDVFDFPVSAQSLKDGTSLTTLHPCPKPLPMWIDLYENYSERGAIVADAFGGSGTAVIAAERTGRKARVCEIEPKYADLIVARWEAETGEVAERVERAEH